MIFIKAKDLKNRNLYNKKEINKKINKFLFVNLLSNNNYSKKEKSKFLYSLLKKRVKIKTRLNRRCIVTNRSRGVFRSFNISRLTLREMTHLGLIPGYTKAVW